MENMDIDMVIDVPDTPDRASERRFRGRENDRKESLPGAVGHSRDFQHYCHFLGGRGRQVPEGGQHIKHHSHPPKNSNSQTENGHDMRALGNAALFRRTAVERDKGKAICNRQKDPVLNLNQRNGCSHFLEEAAPKSSLPSEDAKEVCILNNGGSPLAGAHNSFRAAGNSDKGKEKVDDSAGKLASSASEREGNNGDPLHRKEDHMLPNIRAPRQRKLVRNGCISPQGIAARAKQIVEQDQTSSKDNVNDQNGKAKMASDDQPSIDITEIVGEDDISRRAKGKRPIINPRSSKTNGARIAEFPTSVYGTRAGSRDPIGSEGWRCTRNRQMTMGRSQLDVGHISGQRHETNRRDENALHRSFRFASELEQIHELSPVDRDTSKRQRRNGYTSAVLDESDNSVLRACGESSSSRPWRIQNHHSRGTPNVVLDIDDSSPEVRPSRSRHTRGVDNDESGARARQVEADEILAREIQEQLYQEASLFEDEEIDGNIARMLQHEENSHHTSSSQISRVPNPQIPTNPSRRRRLRARLQQSSSSRRPNLPQAHASIRMTRARGHRLGSSPTALHQTLNFRFPPGMPLESRLDILEELETAVERLGSSTSGNLLQLDRDFNEDDYEMLLALDENNHRHGGASVHQINNLPQLTVQTDNYEETCAVCLETPTTGDVIRHLPCLHKFHKDCIDPWLERSKSCPVCKSSITPSP